MEVNNIKINRKAFALRFFTFSVKIHLVRKVIEVTLDVNNGCSLVSGTTGKVTE